MIVLIIVGVQILTLLLVYPLCKMAAITDEQAERDYIQWRKEQEEQKKQQNEDMEHAHDPSAPAGGFSAERSIDEET